MKRLALLTLVLLVVAASIHALKAESASTLGVGGDAIRESGWLVQHQSTLTPEADRRPADQTFLTFPEWFLVHSPDEQAAYFEQNTSTSFPYSVHVEQFWDSFGIINSVLDGNFPRNDQYQTMIQVIGVSTTTEYVAKSWYETVIGRCTEPRGDGTQTEEDRFTQQYTREYVDFINENPWYMFDYDTRLRELWSSTNFFGPHFLRKMERKYLLTSELVFKSLYGKLIKAGTRSVYGAAAVTTVVVVDKTTPAIEADPTIEVLSRLDDGAAILRVPRYLAFKTAALKLAEQEIEFKEIAGNTSAILISVVAPPGVEFESDHIKELFRHRVPTDPSLQRVAAVTTVPNLSSALRQLNELGTVLHVYDY